MKFTYPYVIGLHDTDAATVLFSANLLRICHQAYEAMLAELGFSVGSILKHRQFGLPLVHVEGDFKIPLRCSDPVEILVSVAELNTRSFRIDYAVMKKEQVAATAATVHVCVDVENYRSKDLPPDLRTALATRMA